MKTKFISLSISLLTLCSMTNPVQADKDSLLRLAVGTSLGMTRSSDATQDESNQAFSPELNLRLKLLRIFGADFAYAPNTAGEEQSPAMPSSQYRLSGILYLLDLETVGVYGKAGIETKEISDLAKMTETLNDYHAGGGFDLNLSEHFAIGSEFLFVVPSDNSDPTQSSKQGLANGDNADQGGVPSLAPSSNNGARGRTQLVRDLFNPSTYRVSVSLRYYF